MAAKDCHAIWDVLVARISGRGGGGGGGAQQLKSLRPRNCW